MKVLFLHGFGSRPGGLKAQYLSQAGLEVINPALPDDDFRKSIEVAQTAYDEHHPDVIVGSSRGGAVAMNIDSADTPLVLLCPAWRRLGAAQTVKPNTLILHSPADETVPFTDSVDLVDASGLPSSSLIVIGQEHRLADPESLAAMHQAILRGVEG